MAGDTVQVEAQARDVSQSLSPVFPGVGFVLAQDSYATAALVVECALSRGDSTVISTAAFHRVAKVTRQTCLVGVDPAPMAPVVATHPEVS